jgi:hypothetical protein
MKKKKNNGNKFILKLFAIVISISMIVPIILSAIR